MRTSLRVGIAAAVSALAIGLAGCGGTSVQDLINQGQQLIEQGQDVLNNSGSGVSAADFADSTWTGTDSDGDSWVFLLHADGTVAVTLGSDSYDDPADTWTLLANTLTITITGFQQGSAVMSGAVTSAAGPLALAGSFTEDSHTWTLTLNRG